MTVSIERTAPLLSFVLPVYNVQKYIRECVESILCQTEGAFEIILVDDGSTDASGAICDEYAKAYQSVTVIHQENGGPSSARNTGLDAAAGKYVSFVDSDDRLAAGSVPKVLDWAADASADLCFLQAVQFLADGRTWDLGDGLHGVRFANKSREEVMQHLACCPKYPGSACTKLYRKAFLQEKGIRFPDQRQLSEDLGFILDCILAAGSFDVLDAPFYEYRQSREGSITSSVSADRIKGLRLFISQSVEKLTKEGRPFDTCSAYAMSFVAYEYAVLLMLSASCEAAEETDHFLYAYRWVAQYGRTCRLKSIRMLIRVFGIRCASIVLRVLYRLTRRRMG